MRVLVLGGTVFLSHAVAAAALAAGHHVTCAARGTSGTVPSGAGHVPVDRSVPGGLEPLRGREFDAVVDVATMSLPWVREALEVLGGRAGHRTFVSSINAYADASVRGAGTDAATLPPKPDAALGDRPQDDPQAYGAIEVACEDAVRPPSERPVWSSSGWRTTTRSSAASGCSPARARCRTGCPPTTGVRRPGRHGDRAGGADRPSGRRDRTRRAGARTRAGPGS